jgi:hypothetical protein
MRLFAPVSLFLYRIISSRPHQINAVKNIVFAIYYLNYNMIDRTLPIHFLEPDPASIHTIILQPAS